MAILPTSWCDHQVSAKGAAVSCCTDCATLQMFGCIEGNDRVDCGPGVALAHGFEAAAGDRQLIEPVLFPAGLRVRRRYGADLRRGRRPRLVGQ